MTIKKTFESLVLEFSANRDVHEVFRDFLVVTLGAFTHNRSVPLTMEAYARYSEAEVKRAFPDILYCLMREINDRRCSDTGNDVLGEFYETHISKDEDKRILPWSECRKMVPLQELGMDIIPKHWPVPLLDVGCRSGRIMLAATGRPDLQFEFLGVEYDFDFILMATLTLFLNFHDSSEVLWIDRDKGNAFRESYLISIFPMGVVRNLDPKKSRAWEQYQLYLQSKEALRQSGR